MYTGPGTTARVAGTCTRCGRPYAAGEIIMRWKNSTQSNASWAHRSCPSTPATEPSSAQDTGDRTRITCSLPDWDLTTMTYDDP